MNYLHLAFPDLDTNPFLRQMFDLINFRRTNQLHTRQWCQIHNQQFIYNECHHIIPRAWFKMNKFPIDNSSSNIVRLTATEHATIHILLKKYYYAIANMAMFRHMVKAVKIIRDTHIDSCSDSDWIKKYGSELQQNKQEYSAIESEIGKNRWRNESAEERKIHLDNLRKGAQKVKDPEIQARRLQTIANKSKEEKEETHKRRVIAGKRMMENMSPETKTLRSKKIREALTGRVWVINQRLGIAKQLPREEAEAKVKEPGWEFGHPNTSTKHANELRAKKILGSRIVNNGYIVKLAKKDEVEKYLSLGWKLGYISK